MPDEDRSSDSEEEDEVVIKFQTLQKDESGYTAQVSMSVNLDEALDMWQEHVTKLKKPICEAGAAGRDSASKN